MSTDFAQFALEKQLCLLTGFQMQILGNSQGIPRPECDTGRILELYGNLCESMLYPDYAVAPSLTVNIS